LGRGLLQALSQKAAAEKDDVFVPPVYSVLAAEKN
jgi:hypothetical protein